MTTGTAIVAGHICLDIIPTFPAETSYDFKTHFQPGSLIRVGSPIFATGGPVSNTGLVLHRLGIPTRLIARTGDDSFGQVVRQIVSGFDPGLVQGIAAIPGETTSYSIIISPPGVDRLFLHCPGANDTFSAGDVSEAMLAQADLLHFGYPPLMRRMYQEQGAELVQLLRQAKSTGITTSLDMCLPDPTTDSGRVDWASVLRLCLPYVDIFLPSLDELLFMLDRPLYETALAGGGTRALLLSRPELVCELGDRLLAMGVRVVLIKLGDLGAYLRTASAGRLRALGRARPQELEGWAERELWAPCFRVRVAGTTGSGDSTIAGFLSALMRAAAQPASQHHLSAVEALNAAVATGACNVEAPDALSGVPDWPAIQRRLAAGWERLPYPTDLSGWKWEVEMGVWRGRNDQPLERNLQGFTPRG